MNENVMGYTLGITKKFGIKDSNQAIQNGSACRKFSLNRSFPYPSNISLNLRFIHFINLIIIHRIDKNRIYQFKPC